MERVSEQVEVAVRSAEQTGRFRHYRALGVGALVGFGCASALCVAALESFGPGVWEQSFLAHLSPVGRELQRVRAYEFELQEREKELRRVLHEIHGVSFALPGQPPLEPVSRKKSKLRGLGGGRDIAPANSVMPSRLDGITERLSRLGRREDPVLSRMRDSAELIRHTPLGFPVAAEITSGFGTRPSPFSGNRQTHTGLDFTVEAKTPVMSTADGFVVRSGWNGAYGQSVAIRHADGVETLYAHLSSRLVKAGEFVSRGQEIGRVGSTGNSTGPHLHYEVRVNGTPRDPVPYVRGLEQLR